MKPWIVPGCVILVVICAGVAAGCGGRSSRAPTAVCIETPPSPPFEEGFPCARQTLIAAATAGLVPEGLIIATKTPDLSAAMSQDETVRALRAAGLGPLLDAVDRNDPDALLAQFDWKLWPCAGRDGDDGCPLGVPTGTQLPKINAGPVTFYVSADTVRPYVTRLMSADALKLTFVSRSKSRPEQYFIEFDGPAQFAGFSPLDSADRAILGISLIVDASAPFPVEHFDLSGIPTNVAPGDTTPTSCLADRASGDATANQQILWVASC